MASESLIVFCAPRELVAWIRRLCQEKNLGSIMFRNSAKFGIVVDTPNSVVLHDDTYRMFLYPSAAPPTSTLMMNDILSRKWGWVDVRPGRIVRVDPMEILTLSELHGEDFEDEPVHPARYVRWLKRRIKGEVTRGVVGKDVVTGDLSTYRNVFYSQGAAALHESGVVWKQFADGNAVFAPAQVHGIARRSFNKSVKR